MSVVFPATLPQYVMVDPSAQPTNNVVRTSTDTGPPKQRQRGTKLIETFDNCALYLNAAQYADFKDWFKNQIGNGALSFTWRHPIEDAEVDVRFVNGLYTVRRPSQGLFKLEFTLETV